MLGNVALDGVFGAVPLVGDAFDVLWRANRRNMRLLREWLEGEGAGSKAAWQIATERVPMRASASPSSPDA
jgi:hypothetical protein